MEPGLPFLYISDQLSMAFCWCNCINEMYDELILSTEEVKGYCQKFLMWHKD
jgi:hypothetical protein